MIDYTELLLRAQKEYPHRTKTVKGITLMPPRWNKDLTMIVTDTVNIYNVNTDTWTEKL